MRVGKAVDVAELRGQPRPDRVLEVEDEGQPGVEAVGEELAVGRHLVLGVVRPVLQAGHRERSDQPAVAAGLLRDVEDREEVGLGGVGGRRPEVEVLRGTGALLGRRGPAREEGEAQHRSRSRAVTAA